MPDGMSLEQWRAKKAQAKPSGGMSLDQWRAAKTAPVAPAPVAPPAPPATSPQLQDPIASALGGGGSIDPSLAPPSMAESWTPEMQWAHQATRDVAAAHAANQRRIDREYGGLGTKIATGVKEALDAPVQAIVQPIQQGLEKGTVMGIGGGLARGAFGGLMAATPIGNAFIQAGNASRLAQESERMGLDVPVLGRIGAAPSMPFEAAAHALPDFEKMRQESRRLGMPGAEALSEVGQLANEALPIAVLGGVHQGIANEVGLRRGIVAPPVPEQLPGTQVGRLRGARPAHVAAPVAPSMRPVPPNVTQTTGVRAASPEMAAELRASNVPLETPAIPAPAPVVETVPGRLRASVGAPPSPPVGLSAPAVRPLRPNVTETSVGTGTRAPSRSGPPNVASNGSLSAELQSADAPGATTAEGPPVRAFVKGGTLRDAFNESAPPRLRTAARKAGYEDVWAAREALRTDENAATMFRAGIADEIAALPDPQATPVTSTEVTGPRLRPAALTPEEPPRAPAPPPPAPAAPAPPQGVRPPKSAESAGPMDRPRFNPMQQEPRAAEPPLLQTTGENPGVMEPGRAPPARDASDFTSDGGGRRPRALPAPEPVKPAPVAEVAPTPRPIPDADAPNVATMQRRSFNEGVRAEKGKPGVETFPADDYGFTEAVFRDENGVVRGVASYSSATDTHKANINVAVDPAFQRKGIASSLYRALEESGVPVSDVSGTMGMTESGAAFVKGRKRIAPAVQPKPASPELPPPAEPAVQAKAETATAREPWQMRAEEYQRDNPHGWRKGATPYQRADAFDALQGDPDVWVFHATTDAAADAMLSGGVRMADKPWTIARERFKSGGDATFQPGSGLGDGLYVGADPMSVDGYGRRILAIKVKKSSIKVPPEGELLGKRTAGRALADSDAHVVGDIKPSAIVDVTEPKKSGSPGHEQFVKRALREGKPVPPEVLAEYPDLVPPAKPAPAPKVEAPAPASVPEIPETSAPAPSPQRAFIDRFVQATREGKTEDAAAEYRAMPPAERTKVHETLVADGLWKRGDGFSLPAIKAHADRVVAAEKAAAPAPAKPYGVNKGKLRRGGKQSGEIVNPVAASEGVYDAADAAGGKLLRSAASAVRENVPGVDKVVTAAEGIRDKWFKSDAANVGPEYLAAKGERRGVEGLGVEHAGRAVKAVDKALRKASPEDVEGVYRYMNGESDALPASLAHRKALFDAVSSEIKSLGSQLVERGLMSQESFDQYVRYLPRLYETKGKLFGGGSDAPRIRETFLREDAPGFKFKAGDYAIIEETARKHGGYAFTEKHGTRAVKFPTVEARDAAYAEVSEALRGQKSRLNQQATGEIRKGEVGQAKMLHRDSMETPSASRMIEKFDAIKPEVLKELGEITDPRAPIQQAIQNAHAKIAADTFFKAVAEGSDAKGPWAVELPRDGYTHIDAQWAGKLRGKYVRNDILPDIQGDFNADKAGFARGWINQWKANKTVWSPRTAARQWFGNPFFMHLAGVDPMNPANWKAIKKAATALHPDSPLRRELVREGVIGPHDFAHIELPTDRAPNMAYRLGQAAANPLMLFRFGRNAQMRMGKAYGSADLVARASIYFRFRERGFSPRDAAAEVRKWTPNYDEVGRATKLLKNSVIGSPFATYSHETLRIVGQALKDHPVRLGTGLLTLAAVQKAFDMAGADEVTEDERKAIEQQRGSQELVIGRDSEGRPLTFGAQYINPIGSLAPKASRLGDDALTNAATYVGDVTGVAQSPLVDTLATMSRGEDRYGRKTSPRAATGYERVMGALEAYGRQVAPGLTPGLGGNYAQVEAAAKGEQLSDRIPKQTLQQAIVSAILGIDVRPFDVGLEKRNLSKQMEGRISSIESDRNTALRESKGKDKDAAPTAVEKLKDTVQDFRARSGVLRKASPPKKDTLPSPQEKP